MSSHWLCSTQPQNHPAILLEFDSGHITSLLSVLKCSLQPQPLADESWVLALLVPGLSHAKHVGHLCLHLPESGLAHPFPSFRQRSLLKALLWASLLHMWSLQMCGMHCLCCVACHLIISHTQTVLRHAHSTGGWRGAVFPWSPPFALWDGSVMPHGGRCLPALASHTQSSSHSSGSPLGFPAIPATPPAWTRASLLFL